MAHPSSSTETSLFEAHVAGSASLDPCLLVGAHTHLAGPQLVTALTHKGGIASGTGSFFDTNINSSSGLE
jgi:hypothetical protein